MLEISKDIDYNKSVENDITFNKKGTHYDYDFDL